MADSPALPAPTAAGTSVARRRASSPARWPVRLVETAVLAVVAFVPVLSVDAGVVTSDTKTYLYLDPTRFLGQVTSMWYPTVALGTVTHQYVGYLLPMGPFYALASVAHVPEWVAQRLWIGAILFVAGTGIAYLCTLMGVRGPGRIAAAFAYMLSPYLLQYAGRISVLLLPWAALGWMVALVVLALRRGGWRYPALFALVVALVSSINATCILYVGIAPALWLVWAVAVEKEATWHEAAAVAMKAGVLALACCAWWITGLVVEAGYGVDILKYTESVSATSSSSSTAEVLRGLGYWYFYGGSSAGPWTPAAVAYTQWVWLVAVSFTLPVLSFAAGVLTRWRHRGYFVVLVVVGVVLSVGPYPYDHPTPLGGVLKAFMNDTTAGLALRSTDRATPLALLGLAMLLGAGVSALWAAVPWAACGTGALVCALALAGNPALFDGDAEALPGDVQPASLPSYELAAIAHLNATHPGTRVLAVPGASFGRYTWGTTTDTPEPALLTRPFATREQQVMGSMATADTLYASDAAIQTDTQNWSSLAPMARLMSAGDILVEYDQTPSRAGSPPAQVVANSLATTPPGLSDPVTFGSPGEGVAAPTLGPEILALPPDEPDPAPLTTYTVQGARPVVRAESDAGTLVVAGNATGLESLAGQGLLDTTGAIYYAGTLDTHPAQLRALLASGATLVVTDSNRKEAFRWNTLDNNYGFIETASDDTAATTPTDAPIDLFPGASQRSETLATFAGALGVSASSSGNTISYTPQDRPSNAIDSTVRTAWETGSFAPDVDGQWWQVDFGHRVEADHITLVQPQQGDRKRSITKVTLTFTGGRSVVVRLGRASRQRSGQTVTFPARRFTTLRVTIDATTGKSTGPVGFAEVDVPGQHVEEVDQLPTDLLGAAGAASVHDPLVIAMTRERVSPYSNEADPEPTLSRSFTLPTSRTFTVSGTATLSSHLHDDQIADLLGVPGATGSGVVATSSSHLTGDLQATAAAAADANPATAWQSAMGAANDVGSWVQYALASPITFDHMTLQVVADRRHSLPTAVTVSATTPDGLHTSSVHLALPALHRSGSAGATDTVALKFAPLTGQVVRVTFTSVHLETAPLVGGGRTNALPLGIAEVGIPGVVVPPAPADLPGVCRSDLIAIDGHPLTVEVAGPTAGAAAGDQVALVPCGKDAAGLHLSAGHHVVETALATTASGVGLGCPAGGRCSGWSVDALTLSSAAGGGPLPEPAPTPAATPAGTRALTPAPVGKAPAVTARDLGPTTTAVTVRHASAPFELVLGESVNAGWHAVAHPGPGAAPGSRPVTLGSPELVDAFANGWQVTARDLRLLGAGSSGAEFTVTLTWAPQQTQDAGMAISAAALLACVALAFIPEPWRLAVRRRLARRRRAGRRRDGHTGTVPERDPVPAHRSPGAARAPCASLTGAPDDHAGPEGPTLSLPVGEPGHRAPWWCVAVVAAGTGALAAAVTGPLYGLFVAASVAAGLVLRRGRLLGALAAVGLVAAAGAMVVAGQALAPVPESGNWPGAYAGAAVVASIGVAFFGADAVTDYVRRRCARSSRSDAEG